ncbi:MAG: ABC transporter ATP-binding protein [Actinomycetota bacterium]|nr:ABC transporter ATP-binding protein [Actinomycetota bacterium]
MIDHSLLRVEGVDVHFGGVTALEEVSLGVEEGEIVGLIGPNGAGKTTLINVVTGVYRPQRGSIEYRGRQVAGMAPHRIVAMGIGRTFQNIRLFNGLSVVEHLLVAQGAGASVWRLAARHSRRSPLDGAETVLGSLEDTLGAFGLWERRHHPATQLPYGSQRHLEIARALATRPELLLLDEPTAGMTEGEAAGVGELIRRIQAAGVGILLIEHNIPFVSAVCDSVTVLNFGRKIAQGSPEEIKQDRRVLEAYLGEDG